MTDYNIRLNKKLNRVDKKRRSTLRSIKANKISGVTYSKDVPDINTCTSAIYVNQNINKIFFNGSDRWYAIDRTTYVVPATNGKHIIFNPRKIMCLDLFYYTDSDKIYLPELTGIEITGDLIIDEIKGYNLYISYVEVL